MKIDLLATSPHWMDHLAPIWRRLPGGHRGQFVSPVIMGSEALRLQLPIGGQRSADAVLVASWADHKKARALGYSHIARIEHGIGQSFSDDHPSYAGGRGADDVELFLTPNEHSAQRWQDAYPHAAVRVVGSPKTDIIPAHFPGRPPIVVASFHWSGNPSMPETGSAFGDFADALLELRHHPDFQLTMHAHPKAARQVRGWAERHGLSFIETFDDVLRVASLYVCDGVSTLYEFAATGRPVIVLNAGAYRPHVEHGLRFWQAADVGIQVDPGDNLELAVRRGLADPQKVQARRHRALRSVYAHQGQATTQAVAALVEWSADIRREVAA